MNIKQEILGWESMHYFVITLKKTALGILFLKSQYFLEYKL